MIARLFKVLLFGLVLSVGQAARAETTLKIATIVPEGSQWMKSMRAGAEQIESRTEGRVKFKFYTGGVMGSDNQVRRKMRIGQLHGGVFSSGSLGEFQKDAILYGLPLLFESTDEVHYVRKRMDGILQRRLEDAGYVSFGFAGGGFAYLLSNDPISSLADMKSMKIWIPEGDKVALRASETLGIAPVTLPLTDVLAGLQTDLIDSVMGPPVGVIVMQWQTVVKYITDLPIAYSYGALLVDKKVFSRISAADQSIVREIMEGIYREFDASNEKDNRSAFQALQDEGLQLVELQPGQAKLWRSKLNASNHTAAQEGVYDLALLEEVQCYLAAYRSQAEPHCGE